MKEIKKVLLAEESRLEHIFQTLKIRLKEAPEGRLLLSKNKYGRMYYHYHEKKKYISKENQELVRALAQKSYDQKVLKQADEILEKIKELRELYDTNNLEQIYHSEHPDRRQYIIPVEPTWEQQVEQWRNKPYEGLAFREDTPIILTEKGERVRSKSEKIIADYLFRNGIEYKYECPLYLKGMGIVHPDFTILSRKTRKEIYLEHMGMMDEPGYARKAVKKINTYEENGYFVGESLLITYETDQTVLSTQQLERLMKKYMM